MKLSRILVVLLALAVTADAQVPTYHWPALPTQATGPPSAAGVTLNANGDSLCGIFVATVAKEIDKVYVRTATVTTGDTVDVRIGTVDSAANGDPTGTLFGTNTNAALVIANSDDNVWKTATLTANAVLAIGDVFSVCVVNGASGNLQIPLYSDMSVGGIPYGDVFDAAAWVKNANTPQYILEYHDGTFAPIYGVADSGGITATNFDSDDTTNRRGNIFQVAASVTAKGAWGWVDGDNAWTIKLYDTDGSTVLCTTASINSFQRQGTAAATYFLPFTSAGNCTGGSVTLSPGNNYRIAYVPSTTSVITAYDFDVPSAAALDQFPGGSTMHMSLFTSSAWVETTTRRVWVGLILQDTNTSTGRRGIIGG